MLTAKRFAIGFGIAIILPFLVHFGVATFAASPKWADYHPDNRVSCGSPEPEKAAQAKEQCRRDEQFVAAQKRFSHQEFNAAVPIGIVAMILGSVLALGGVGPGLLFGGILTAVYGYGSDWHYLSDGVRFYSLLSILALLVALAYFKIEQGARSNGKPTAASGG